MFRGFIDGIDQMKHVFRSVLISEAMFNKAVKEFRPIFNENQELIPEQRSHLDTIIDYAASPLSTFAFNDDDVYGFDYNAQIGRSKLFLAMHANRHLMPYLLNLVRIPVDKREKFMAELFLTICRTGYQVDFARDFLSIQKVNLFVECHHNLVKDSFISRFFGMTDTRFYADILKLLLENTDVNQKDHRGHHLIHIFLQRVEEKCPESERDILEGKMAFEYLISHPSINIHTILAIQAEFDFTKHEYGHHFVNHIQAAIRANDKLVIKQLHAERVNPASYFGQYAVVKDVVDKIENLIGKKETYKSL